eukprot:m.340788 g.340788  ORF g.340788 m.340788 type:complete len:543 (+) comp19533_c0_seq1:21-1649(+)
MAEQFAAIANCDVATAASFLEAAGGDLDTAMALFFDGGMAPAANESGNSDVPSEAKPDWYKLVWGEGSPSSAWKKQPLVFTTYTEGCPYSGLGIEQPENGPCGVLAVIQAAALLALQKTSPMSHTSQGLVDNIASGIVSILRTSIMNAEGDVCKLAMWTGEGHKCNENATNVEFVDITKDSLEDTVVKMIDHYTQPGGLILIIYSCVLTRGVDTIIKDIRSAGGEPPLILPPVAFCSSELLSLLLKGNANGNLGAYGPTGGTKVSFYSKDDEHLSIGMLSMAELDGGGVPLADDLKSPDAPFWIIHGGSHFTIMFLDPSNEKLDLPVLTDENRHMDISPKAIKLLHWNGLPPGGPRMTSLQLTATYVCGPAPTNHRQGVGVFYKPIVNHPDGSEIDSIVQAHATDKTKYPGKWDEWRYEVVLAQEEEGVEGEERPKDKPLPSLYKLPVEGPSPGEPWRCAACYATRFKTMNFGQNDAGATVCATCGKTPKDAGFSFWMHFKDLPRGHQQQMTIRHAPKICSILATKWPGCKVTWSDTQAPSV